MLSFVADRVQLYTITGFASGLNKLIKTWNVYYNSSQQSYIKILTVWETKFANSKTQPEI